MMSIRKHWKHLKKYEEMDIEAESEKRSKELEKGDIPAILLSAFLTLWLPALILLVLLCCCGLLFTGFPLDGKTI